MLVGTGLYPQVNVEASTRVPLQGSSLSFKNDSIMEVATASLDTKLMVSNQADQNSYSYEAFSHFDSEFIELAEQPNKLEMSLSLAMQGFKYPMDFDRKSFDSMIPFIYYL